MKKLVALVICMLAVLAASALARTGVAGFTSDLQGVPGVFEMPYDTGPPPTFLPGQRFAPAGGGPPIPLGDDEFPYVAVTEPGGRIHHFTIWQDPAIPNLAWVRYHDDLNGNGLVDPGETVSIRPA